MQDDIAVSIQGVSKRYVIAHQFERAPIGLPKLGQRLRDAARRTSREEFWALRDVSFDVRKCDILGIIGKNGAGKSTLLKVLSRITEPTVGTIDIYGRVGSLLEVGTGFHPELTGRENIFLNGSILGMHRGEIQGRFDEIVEFSGVEKFLDTPVKRYSSGMYVRLAFAVAAHLDPEILIIDEVLAVGDAEFQRKCLGKIRDVAGSGRTVLFVSHNLSVVSAICNRAVLMDKGSVVTEGSVGDVVACYHSLSMPAREIHSLSEAPRTGLGNVRFDYLSVSTSNIGEFETAAICEGSDVDIEVGLACTLDVVLATIAVIVYDSSGFRLIDVNTAIKKRHVSMGAGERLTVRFTLEHIWLRAGSYPVGLWVGRHGIEDYDNIEFAGSFDVVDAPDGARQAELYPGPYTCPFKLEIERSLGLKAQQVETLLA